MRHTLVCFSFAVAILAAGGSSTAQAAPWCSTKDGLSCGYYTFQQCLDAIRGVGGNCTQNPHESARGGAAQGQGGARVREERRARDEQRAKAREEQRARAREEQKARQATPPKEQPAKPAPTAAEPAKPATPPPPPVAATPAPAAGSSARKPSPADARVYFVGLQNGAEVPSQLTVRFGITNMGVAPAGLDNPNSGHHHLLIDTALPSLDLPIPSDFNHLHFGAGQTEAEITLPPGKHKLQLLFADENHVPHNPPVMSAPIEVVVKAKR
jgi:hypothetical protein